MRFIGLALVLLTISAVCSATLIVTREAPFRIIIAADGLATHPETQTNEKVCTIIQGGHDCFFSISGLRDVKDAKYDLVLLAQSACNEAGPIVQRARDFQATALPEIRRLGLR